MQGGEFSQELLASRLDWIGLENQDQFSRRKWQTWLYDIPAELSPFLKPSLNIQRFPYLNLAALIFSNSSLFSATETIPPMLLLRDRSSREQLKPGYQRFLEAGMIRDNHLPCACGKSRWDPSYCSKRQIRGYLMLQSQDIDHANINHIWAD